MKKMIVLLLAFGLLVAACGDSQEDAEAALCDDLGSLAEALQSAEALDPATVTVDDINDAADAVNSAWDDVKSSAENVDNVRTDNVQSAIDDFKSTVSGISGDSSIPEAQQQVAQAAVTLQSQVDAVTGELSCS